MAQWATLYSACVEHTGSGSGAIVYFQAPHAPPKLQPAPTSAPWVTSDSGRVQPTHSPCCAPECVKDWAAWEMQTGMLPSRALEMPVPTGVGPFSCCKDDSGNTEEPDMVSVQPWVSASRVSSGFMLPSCWCKCSKAIWCQMQFPTALWLPPFKNFGTGNRQSTCFTWPQEETPTATAWMLWLAVARKQEPGGLHCSL